VARADRKRRRPGSRSGRRGLHFLHVLGHDLHRLAELVGRTELDDAPRWLLRLILPVAIRKREREQNYRLLPATIREHAEAARLDNTYPHYREVTAEVLLMTCKDASTTGAGRASQSLLPVLPKATLARFPALDHLGPEKKPKQVAEAVSAFFPEHASSSSGSMT
jgi:pimeloyl-ACP methyl ester carboxylesterase